MSIPAGRYPAARGPGDAALVVALAATGTAVPALAAGAAWLLPPGYGRGATDPSPWASAVGLAVVLAPLLVLLSWVLAAAASLTAVVVLRRDRADRRARLALLISAPGTVLGTAAVVAVLVWLGSWRPIP